MTISKETIEKIIKDLKIRRNTYAGVEYVKVSLNAQINSWETVLESDECGPPEEDIIANKTTIQTDAVAQFMAFCAEKGHEIPDSYFEEFFGA